MPSLSRRETALVALVALAALVIVLTAAAEPVAAQEAPYQIRGVVLGPDDEPLQGIEVRAQGHTVEGYRRLRGSSTGSDGAFAVDVFEGGYILELFVLLEDVECRLAFVGRDGLASQMSFSEKRITVDAHEAWNITVRLPDTPSELCRRIQGVVRGPDGEPLEGVWVETRLTGSTATWSTTTDSDGSFRAAVPDGSYRFELYHSLGTTHVNACELGFAGSDGTVVPSRSQVLPLLINGGDATDLVVRLPGTVSELCTRIEGVVTNATGEALERVRVWAQGEGPLLGFEGGGNTSTDGTFGMFAHQGPYRLRVQTDAGTFCTLVGYPGGGPGQRARFSVGPEGLSGIRIVISGRPLPARGTTTCFFAPETVTTVLRPGYNLIGWTAAGMAVHDLFEGIPQLRTVHAWDPLAQRFRSASRPDIGVEGDLVEVTPGMGLWMSIGGAEQVSWTRPPPLTEAQAHLVSLKPGWNLVAWSGREDIAAEKALAGLDAEFGEVWAWDAAREGYVPLGNGPPGLSRNAWRPNHGEGLWVYSKDARSWLQPGWPQPDIRFLGDFATNFPDSARAAVERVQLFYAERYGAITSDVTFYFASDGEALRQGGGPADSEGWCASAGATEIFIITSKCLAVAHEYFHVIQKALSRESFKGTPIWMYEGSALYTDFQHRYSVGIPSSEDRYRNAWLALNTPLDSNFNEYFQPRLRIFRAFTFGYNVMQWLSDNVAESAIIDYFSALPEADSWPEAFHSAFGMTVDEFYTAFEEYRLEISPAFDRRIEGTVLDRAGQPVEGLVVSASLVVDGSVYRGRSVSTDATGAFAIGNGPGTGYVLLLAGKCQNGAEYGVGAVGKSGFEERLQESWLAAAAFTGEGQDRTGITVTLPATLEELEREHC